MPTSWHTKNQTEYPKKSRFSREKSEFHQKTITSTAREDCSVITDSAKIPAHVDASFNVFVGIVGFTFTWFYTITRLLSSLGRFLFCSVFDLLGFNEKSCFQEAIPYYRISLFFRTEYDKIILVGIFINIIIHLFWLWAKDSQKANLITIPVWLAENPIERR